jgi:purine-binding chemotaxis protein CheW
MRIQMTVQRGEYAATRGGLDPVMVERAQRLGKRPAIAKQGIWTDALVFRLGKERYGVELTDLRSIEPVKGLTPLPCAPRFVAGLINLRGEMLTVLQLARALDLPQASNDTQESRILVAEVAGGIIGLLVDAVTGVEAMSTSQLQRSLSGREFVIGIDKGGTVLLDLQRLLSSERFALADEAG